MFNEVMNQRKFSLIREFIADNYVNHGLPGATGPEGMVRVIEGFFHGFPDMHIQVDQVIGDGDMVATRGEWTGTHSGEFMGIPATGKKVRVGYIDLWKMQNGKGVENWVQMDLVSMMQQLGVMPEPSHA